MRICVDLCKLTESVKSVNLTLPAIDQTLGQVSGAGVFQQTRRQVRILADRAVGGV